MRINKTNLNEIKASDVYMHDDRLLNLKYNYQERKITLLICDEFDNNKSYNVDFIDVIGFYCTGCDFWGISPYIFDFELVEKDNQIVIQELKKHGEKTPHFKFKMELDDYLEIRMTFTSGDRLRIACREIVFCKDC